MSNEDQVLNLLRKHTEELGEHFDTVQIFVTRHNGGDGEDSGTVNASWGSGNWFARFGQVHQWTTKKNEETKEEVRRADDN